MNNRLLQRRYRMLQLLAVSNTLQNVVPAVSKEFECTQDTVYRDYQNMDRWCEKYRQDKQIGNILYARLELLNRTATEHMLSAEKTADKIRAANLVLKITQEQIRTENELQKNRSHDLLETQTLTMPFACDPLIKGLLEIEAKKQREEYEARKAALKLSEKH